MRAWQEQSSFFSTERRYYLYDQGNAVCELDTNGNVVATNVYAPDGLVGRSSGGTTRQYLFDVQGNVAHAMTSSSAVSMSAAYTAWGQRNYVYPFQAPSQWDDCFGYNARWGYVKDATGLYYCQNRYYDPANGRWLTRDPIGYEGGINLYGYCGGGPVGAVDPWGLGWRGLVGGILGGLVGLGAAALTGPAALVDAIPSIAAGVAAGTLYGDQLDGEDIGTSFRDAGQAAMDTVVLGYSGGIAFGPDLSVVEEGCEAMRVFPTIPLCRAVLTGQDTGRHEPLKRVLWKSLAAAISVE